MFPAGVIAYIKNTSEQPIYDVTIDWRQETSPWDGADRLLVLMPGGQHDSVRNYPENDTAVSGLFGFVLQRLAPVGHFRDAAGASWRLRPDGQLDEESRPGNAVTAIRRPTSRSGALSLYIAPDVG
jgi:hypothetical protein